jgi:hypothetical protein
MNQYPTETFEPVTNPREDSNMGILTLFHRRLILGDKNTNPAGGLLTFEGAMFVEKNSVCPTAGGGSEPCLVVPVYGLDHSGIAVNTTGFHCPFDSARLGIIYTPYSRIRECYGRDRVTSALLERARRRLVTEVEEYNLYLQG